MSKSVVFQLMAGIQILQLAKWIINPGVELPGT